MPDEIRALTVRQPWAHMIVHCGKTVENRSKPVSYRGLAAIHAGAYSRWDRAAEQDILARHAWLQWAVTLPPLNLADPRLNKNAIHIDFGAVIAVAGLAGCHADTECTDETGTRWPNGRRRCSPWARKGQWHWQLENVHPLARPVPCRGMLGLWRLPEDVEKAVRAQLEASNE